LLFVLFKSADYCLFDKGFNHTGLIQSELINITRVAIEKKQSCLLIHFELVGVIDPKEKKEN
jgi:hypothetical protein